MIANWLDFNGNENFERGFEMEGEESDEYLMGPEGENYTTYVVYLVYAEAVADYKDEYLDGSLSPEEFLDKEKFTLVIIAEKVMIV